MITGALLISWSIRVSMALLVATLLLWMWPGGQRSGTLAKWLWTASFALSLVHVLSSFHFVHHWSHHQAYLATAKETGELMGVEFGGGVYFNYLFLAAWAVHLLHLWNPVAQHSLILRWVIQVCLIYLLFIAFNGVVVFKSGWLRLLGVLCTVILLIVAAGHWFKSSARVSHLDHVAD